MTTILFNPLLANLAAFEAMTHGQRCAAGRQARQDAADVGYANKAGKRTVTLPSGAKATLTMFSA